jgi:hydrogenase nickel incorporation protein HypB
MHQAVLMENDRVAASLRTQFEASGLLSVNVVGAPGSGKTALLERTLRTLPAHIRAAVLTSDIQTDTDARRLARAGYPVRQIATGGRCHLDATMVVRALDEWDLSALDLLFIENVGNLVCPATVDLGEAATIVLLSVTQSDETPEKYADIYRRAALVIITKADLVRHVDFDLHAASARIDRVHPGLPQILVSSRTGEGMRPWHRWLAAHRAAAAAPAEVV